MSNSNSELDALGRGLLGSGGEDFIGLGEDEASVYRGIGALAFQMSCGHLLSVNKPIYDLHALDTHL
jgi:hypothetical protein